MDKVVIASDAHMDSFVLLSGKKSGKTEGKGSSYAVGVSGFGD